MQEPWTSPRDSLHHEIAKLRSQVEDQKATIANLMEQLHGSDIDLSVMWRLSDKEARILSGLLCGRLLTKEQILYRMYVCDNDASEVDIKIVDVLIHRVRKTIEPSGVTIDTVWGRGYRMSARSIKLVKDLCSPKTLTEEAA